MKEFVILLVDDEPMVLESLSEELERNFGRSYQIEAAESGEEALEILEEFSVDGIETAVVISDQMMPGLKGDELLSQIHRQHPDILKIMLTGQAEADAVGNAVNSANLYRYIAKPWDATDLNLTIKEALKKYHYIKKLEEQNARLRENERRLNQILEAMPIGVTVHNTTGKMTYANQKAKELLNLENLPETNTEQLSTTFNVYQAGTDELYPTEQLPIVRSLAGEGVRVEDLEIHYPDRIVPLEVSTTPIRDKTNGVFQAISAFQDISDRKKAEAERENFTRELFQLNEAFSQFVPRQFLHFLARKDITEIKLGESIEKKLSVLFSDIRSFTTRSEQMNREDTFNFINGYLKRMEPAIIENEGFIDKYIGDAIMALFEGSADRAVNAGVKMLENLAEYNQTRQRRDRQPIEIGIGINTGHLRLGTVGGNARIDTTVIGDAVNLGSRLEQLTKVYKTPLLISHNTFVNLQDSTKYALRLIARVQVRGKVEKVGVFEVFEADPPDRKQAKLATKMMFEMALIYYERGRTQEARPLFDRCLQQNPWDSIAQIYLERCRL
ncbi:response regulator [Oscillatoriales cyanobacterium LEGE 11467]|uniref:Response regulator n=1 Tax=Zarconia navalis LEGE 11467 TaxID=1828826 RepID=A0A928VZF6_9CYAN|nr:adenylate/guanylate cyclase domain-containing protein [Zarconia navalis]MBE9041023.1 response regulator [Zarconia navalis LEGE 11467]